MKTPKQLEPLVADGLVDEVIGSLKSGKEAAVYLVRSRGKVCCAKVYKEASHRSFKQAVQYREGRKVRNSRQARAMEKGSRYGRQEQESAWQNAEVSALYRLQAAGVRVPEPYGFYDGVLLMEMISDEQGDPAPRLNDVLEMSVEQALDYHARMMREIVRMLCAGLVHGDLSEYNVLMDAQGPVIIDLPQAVDAAGNLHANRMLLRDVGNMTAYFSRFAPELQPTRYGEELWSAYESGILTPEFTLTGTFQEKRSYVDVDGVLREISDALAEEQARQRARSDAASGREMV
ncbi:MAG: serine protein kinase RIO [Pseudomonadales bacterium]|nr:serine protein kinase RIO [Pseudomonadales bacterium]